ncbi:MAG: hypothetical protein O3A95_09805 [Planctomycetota bacterium]|nr:hypothetical protein [Planctomycetota bacterium]MDA1114576.1 hypothetical protein [Planctomycetota bacterium]
MGDDIRPLLHRISGAVSGGRVHNLTAEAAEKLFGMLLEGDGTDAQIAMFLASMRVKGTTAEELVGAARAARARIEFPKLPVNCVVVATSRHGKRHSPPMVLAAAAAAAAAGVPILLQSGPSLIGGGVTPGEVWQRMIGPLLGDANYAEEQLAEFGLACWQPTLADSGWQRMQRIEDETGIRGIPDVVCKLVLPEGCAVLAAALPGPVLGMAGDAFESLGHSQCMIVQGVEGSVDPSVVETTRGLRLLNGVKAPVRMRPSDFARCEKGEPGISHEDPIEAAVIATQQALLASTGPEACSAVLGASLLISLVSPDANLATCMGRAVDALESGAAAHLLQKLKKA